MTSTCIITARGGSRRIPRKNIRNFNGKPIIAYSIKAAEDSGLFSRIVVSTEDSEIASIAKRYGAEIVYRPSELAEVGHVDCGTQSVTRHALLALGIKEGYACCLYPCAPLVTGADLVMGYTTLLALRRPYVYVDGWWYWSTVSEFIMRPNIQKTNCDHCGSMAALKLEGPYGRWVDINTESDWTRAERMYEDWSKVVYL